MEYLVTMTTHVPEGVAEEQVVDVRAREAANTRKLASQGRVLRLWRPPLQPGEWRTLGLFAADGRDDLEQILATMPLRVWRTDEVTPLTIHPNDPGPGRVALDPAWHEYFTTFHLAVPPGTQQEAIEKMSAQEASRAAELAIAGRLLRLWTLSGEGENLGLWQAEGDGEITAMLDSLPMAPWLSVDTLPLTMHPSDPPTSGAHPAHY